ncbi:hypothetical protein Tco_0083978 [Tanacetum coccineum]
MLDKDLYDSWRSQMELYMQNREPRRMILEPVEHGPLIWPTVEDNGVIRTKKYAELSATGKFNQIQKLGNQEQKLDEEHLCYSMADPGYPASQAQTVIPHNAAFQTEDLDTYDSDCDDLSTAQVVLMANISNYGSDVILEVPNSETYLNDMDNQSVHALQNFKQSPVMDFIDNEISSDSNSIPYLQYLQETHQTTVQDINLLAQQDSMILSVIEQIENTKEENVNPDKCDLEPINKELENSVANLLSENELEQAKAKQPLDKELDFACKYATRILELLVYVQDTCPNTITPSAKKVESSNTSYSNTPVLSSTGVKRSTSNCGSKPPDNKKNDRILQTPSRNKKNKVEARPRKVNHVVKPVCDVDVKHSLSKANSEILCATCNKSMFDGVHDKCLLDLVQNGNNRTKSAKNIRKQMFGKPTSLYSLK